MILDSHEYVLDEEIFLVEEEEEEEEGGGELEDSRDENSGDEDDESGDEGGGIDEDDEGEDEGGDSDEDGEEDINVDDYTPEIRGDDGRDDGVNNDGGNDEDDEDLDIDDKKAINKVIDQKLTPLQKQIQKQNDEIEVNSYIVDNPELAKYKPVILKYMNNSAYKNVPVKNIAAIVSANEMQRIGARKERDAARKANNTKNKGSQARKPDGGKVDWLNASKEEFNKKLAEVKGIRI